LSYEIKEEKRQILEYQKRNRESILRKENEEEMKKEKKLQETKIRIEEKSKNLNKMPKESPQKTILALHRLKRIKKAAEKETNFSFESEIKPIIASGMEKIKAELVQLETEMKTLKGENYEK
jgi:hypothetical protein